METVELDFVLSGKRFRGTVGFTLSNDRKVVEIDVDKLDYGFLLERCFNERIYCGDNVTSITFREALAREITHALKNDAYCGKCRLTGIRAEEDELVNAERYGTILRELAVWFPVEGKYVYKGNTACETCE